MRRDTVFDRLILEVAALDQPEFRRFGLGPRH